MSEEKTIGKLVQVRISEQEHEALVVRVGKRGMQSHLRLLISEFVKGASGYSYNAENKVWHDRLERILTEGSERDRIGIEQNIEWAVKSLGTRPSKKTKTG